MYGFNTLPSSLASPSRDLPVNLIKNKKNQFNFKKKKWKKSQRYQGCFLSCWTVQRCFGCKHKQRQMKFFALSETCRNFKKKLKLINYVSKIETYVIPNSVIEIEFGSEDFLDFFVFCRTIERRLKKTKIIIK